jgi:gluconate kinase
MKEQVMRYIKRVGMSTVSNVSFVYEMEGETRFLTHRCRTRPGHYLPRV